jgi:16S rRNA (adenine1518-N6/adenine1519-N6)-dimethyltransferase
VVRAKRSLGQNFLVDPHYQQRIVDAVAPDGATVLEIGPGTGALTRHLARRAARLVAIELDDALAAQLRQQFEGDESVRIAHADFLALEPAEINVDPAAAKVVGNIPYYITTPIIFRLLEAQWRPLTITLMVQREVADRILAPPGDREFGALSVGVRTAAAAVRLFNVPRGAFRPVPNVDSSVVQITPLRPYPLSAAEEADLRTLTRVAFGWRRKQFQRILRSAEPFRLSEYEIERVSNATGINMKLRPEAVGPDAFVALSRALREIDRPLGTHTEIDAP